jgi:methyl-accepting chemotaxis protein
MEETAQAMEETAQAMEETAQAMEETAQAMEETAQAMAETTQKHRSAKRSRTTLEEQYPQPGSDALCLCQPLQCCHPWM